MKISKMLVFVAIAFATSSVFADAGNTLVTFSTKGKDLYGDKSEVKDGEWYALCWSPRAEFGGLTSTCEAAVDGDIVFLVAPLAEGGRCPQVVFQIDSKVAPSDGNYFVYLLDTRDAAGNVSASDPKTHRPVVLNGAVATTAKAPATSATGASIVVSDADLSTAGGVVAWADSAIDESVVGRPEVASFDVAGDKAVFKVANLHPSVRYSIFAGESPDKITESALELPNSADATNATFYVDKEKGRYFRVGRRPLK